MKPGATAPPLYLATAAKRQLLEVDLAGNDPALMGGRKRLRISGVKEDDDDDGDGDADEGHVGGRGGWDLYRGVLPMFYRR